jgi:hypothetical protein
MDYLGVEGLYLLFELLFLFALFEELLRTLLECFHDVVFVLFDFAFLLLQLLHLHQLGFVDQHLVFLLQLRPQLLQFVLVLPNQRPLVQILVDCGFVLNALGSVGELEGGERLMEGLCRRRNHGEHSGFAVAAETVAQESRK